MFNIIWCFQHSTRLEGKRMGETTFWSIGSGWAVFQVSKSEAPKLTACSIQFAHGRITHKITYIYIRLYIMKAKRVANRMKQVSHTG